MLAGTYRFVFTLPFSVSSGFGSSLRTISPWECRLAKFQYKKDKKNWAKVKLTALSKTRDRTLKFKSNKPWNIEIRLSQISNHDLCFLRGPFFKTFQVGPNRKNWVLDRNFRKFWLNGSRPWPPAFKVCIQDSVLYYNIGGVFQQFARYTMRYQESNLHLDLHSPWLLLTILILIFSTQSLLSSSSPKKS